VTTAAAFDRGASRYDLLVGLNPGCHRELRIAGDAQARLIWDAVCRAVIIPLGVLVNRNHDLYHYLWRSVVDFDSVTQFADRLAAAGFEDVAHRTATGWQQGILHTFVARKPRENP
jgi:ubiquinone/menaquinone biosynthesis C-methylase UbiE